MIYRAYKYCFYHFYAYGLKKWGEKSYPQYWAAFVVALFACLNIYTILIVFEIVSGIKAFTFYVMEDKSLRMVGIGLLFTLHYFLFVWNGKYREISHEFMHDKTTENKKKRRAMYLGVYVLSTVIFLFISGWLFIAKS